MVRTQIQLPDEIYAELKALAKERETSLAELVRRGVEYLLDIYPRHKKRETEWEFPTFNGGWRGLSDAEIKEQAQMTTCEERLMDEARTRRQTKAAA